MTNARPVLSRPYVLSAVMVIAATVLVIAGSGLVSTIGRMYPLALPASPYFVPQHFVQFYVALPLTIVAAVVVILTPGLVLALLLCRRTSTCDLLVRAFGLAYVFHFVVFSTVRLLGAAHDRRGSAAVLCATAVCGAAALLWLSSRDTKPHFDDARVEWRRLAWVVGLAAACVLCLLPVLMWQDMNPDGLEVFRLGRSLFTHVLPLGDFERDPGLGDGLLAIAFPISWFQALLGVNEATARLPVVLLIPLLFAAVVALIELRAPRRLTRGEEALVVLALAVFVVTIGFNATNHPYSADISSPANIDFLAVTCIVAATYFLWRGEWPWFLLFVSLLHVTRPTSLLFLGLTAVSVVLVSGRKSGRRLLEVGTALIVCLVWTELYERVIPIFSGHPISNGASLIVERVRFLAFDQFGRFLFLLIPTGILPALSLLSFRRQDDIARSLALITCGYFAFFYIVAFTGLHHYAPAMVLPVVVYWRMALQARPNPARLVASTLVTACCFWISLPRSFAVDRSTRRVGARTVFRIGDYTASDEARSRAAWDQRLLLERLFKPDWAVEDPGAEHMIYAEDLLFYASTAGRPGPDTNYLVQSLAEPVVEGFTRVGQNQVAAVFVRDASRWQADRSEHVNMDFRARIYSIPRERSNRIWGVKAGKYSVDLGQVVRSVIERVRGR